MSDRYFEAVRTRRSELELKVQILQAISEGANKQAQVIQKSNISWSMAQNFIRRLEMQGLLESKRTKGRKHLAITDRGKRVLNSYVSIIKEFEFEFPEQQAEAPKILLP